MRLLLVEDNARLSELLSEVLRDAGYGVDCVATTAQFRSAVKSIAYDLCVVDLGLPDGVGLDVIRDLRGERVNLPILVVTARAAIDDRVAGLDSGADDYLSKPFNNVELLARVRALLRRPSELAEAVLRVGDTELNAATGEIRCGGQRIDLRLSERRLLAVLMRRHGSIVPKARIEEALSQFGRDLSPNAIEALVSRLRRALVEARSAVHIETVRGVGYILEEKRTTQ